MAKSSRKLPEATQPAVIAHDENRAGVAGAAQRIPNLPEYPMAATVGYQQGQAMIGDFLFRQWKDGAGRPWLSIDALNIKPHTDLDATGYVALLQFLQTVQADMTSPGV